MATSVRTSVLNTAALVAAVLTLGVGVQPGTAEEARASEPVSIDLAPVAPMVPAAPVAASRVVTPTTVERVTASVAAPKAVVRKAATKRVEPRSSSTTPRRATAPRVRPVAAAPTSPAAVHPTAPAAPAESAEVEAGPSVRSVDWNRARIEQPGVGTIVLASGTGTLAGTTVTLKSVTFGDVFGRGEVALVLVERTDDTGTYADIHTFQYVTLPDNSRVVLGELQPPLDGDPSLTFSIEAVEVTSVAVKGDTVTLAVDGTEMVLVQSGDSNCSLRVA